MVLFENEVQPEAPDVISIDEVEVDLDVDINGTRVLESCHSIWVFDPSRMRFRRVPRGARLDMPAAESEWTPYFRLEVEPSSGAFAVSLTADGTRALRSWLHTEACRHCAADQTGELSLGGLHRSR